MIYALLSVGGICLPDVYYGFNINFDFVCLKDARRSETNRRREKFNTLRSALIVEHERSELLENKHERGAGGEPETLREILDSGDRDEKVGSGGDFCLQLGSAEREAPSRRTFLQTSGQLKDTECLLQYLNGGQILCRGKPQLHSSPGGSKVPTQAYMV